MTNSEKLSTQKFELTPQMLLHAYTVGMFPMAEHRNDTNLFWVDPEMRGILPLDNLHISRSLKKTIRQNQFEIRYNTSFYQVITNCAKTKENRQTTWINNQIIDLYTKLFQMGHSHTVECWQDNQLVGGLYGISLQGAFFGESMFSLKPDASKVALVHLVARLIEDSFDLLDTQFTTDHLLRLGAIEIQREVYLNHLKKALMIDAKFNANGSRRKHQLYVESLLQN
jgi:leucyl/phenylalanyl-tRNA--protein transferase